MEGQAVAGEAVMHLSRPPEVLLVEDNPDDIALIRRGFKRGAGAVNLAVLSDGKEVLAFLRRQGPYAAARAPDLILLDLNLPGKDGREVLAELKLDPALKQIPVVVLTSSEAEQDVVGSYRCQANCYVTKPVDLDQFLSAIRAIREFWLTLATLPPPPA
jgi:CheY-like chemotaxis protein